MSLDIVVRLDGEPVTGVDDLIRGSMPSASAAR
jgi:hypothetical protein